MPLSLQHVVDIYLPEAGGAPYPTMVMLTGRAYRPVQYSSLAQQFVERGYAVVVVGYRISPAPETYRAAGIADVSCAFAWLMTHTATYGLDPQRVFVLGHDTGGFIAVISSLYDTASWKDTMTGCPYPLPDRAAVKGVITYDAFLGIPEGTLGAWPMDYAVDWNIPESEMSPTVKTLRAVPPQEWRTSELLDDNARKLATMLPLYWAYQARDAQAALPPYLLIYSGDTCYGDWGCGFFDWATEAEAMARAMRTAGVAATAQLLPNENASHRDLVKSNSGVPAQVAEAVDVFIRELSK
jgi:acetyl esterase/lipase